MMLKASTISSFPTILGEWQGPPGGEAAKEVSWEEGRTDPLGPGKQKDTAPSPSGWSAKLIFDIGDLHWPLLHRSQLRRRQGHAGGPVGDG
jgi:hypothetical protein